MVSIVKLVLHLVVYTYAVYTAAWLLRSHTAAGDLRHFAVADYNAVRAAAECYKNGFVDCMDVPEHARQMMVDSLANYGRMTADAILAAVDKFCRAHQCTSAQ